MKRGLFGWIAGVAAAAIVAASILVRFAGPADPVADVSKQRADVTRFHALVRAGRWDEVFRSMTEPPGHDAASFAALMRDEVEGSGKVTRVQIDEMQLLRSRTTPLLEVRETLTVSTREGTTKRRTVSYFARRSERWLFAFSAPATDD